MGGFNEVILLTFQKIVSLDFFFNVRIVFSIHKLRTIFTVISLINFILKKRNVTLALKHISLIIVKIRSMVSCSSAKRGFASEHGICTFFILADPTS